MRIPTEAELIEMEGRAAILPRVVGKMERKIAKDRERMSARVFGADGKVHRREERARVLRQLARDVEALIEIVRSGVLRA